MFGQIFNASDIPSLITLAFLEILLSADNAIVLGVITHSLPKELRRKALLIGTVSAFFFRAFALIGISFLLKHLWIQLLGGAYLLYLAAHHFLKKKNKEPLIPEGGKHFWKTVALIELFDLAFAIDSIIAGLAFISATNTESGINPKLWIVYFGGMIGLFGIRYAAQLFSSLIDRFPRLEISAYLLIGWIGIKLLYTVLDEIYLYPFPFKPLFWTLLVLLLGFGFTKRKKA